MFAIWLTGPPASGKSTLAAALVKLLRARRIDPVVLESDALRKHFSVDYSEEGRTAFYRGMAHIGAMFVSHAVPVIFDATANRRVHRDGARKLIPKFIEVFVDCPLEVCVARDPKGLYRQAREGSITTMPGPQTDYEPPERPDVHIRGDQEEPDAAARRIMEVLMERGLVTRKL